MKKSHKYVKSEALNYLNKIKEFSALSSLKVILELGSRDGLVSIYLKKSLPNAKIFAFECNPDAILICRKNIGNQKNGIFLVEKAVSNVNATLDFYSIDPEKTETPFEDGNIGASSLFKANPDYPNERYVQKRIQVESVTIASWAKANGIDAIDALWMDLQGAELLALEGMGDLLDSVRFIYTEVNFREMYIGQSLFPELHNFLLRKQFFPYRIYGWKWFGNAIYVRSDMKRRRQGYFERLLSKYFL